MSVPHVCKCSKCGRGMDGVGVAGALWRDGAEPDPRDATIARQAGELQALADKARKWDALMNCRIRTLGGAKIDDAGPYAYLTLEFWTGHPAGNESDQPFVREWFERFMRKAEAALSPVAAGEE